MGEFISKKHKIYAQQWTGDNTNEVREFLSKHGINTAYITTINRDGICDHGVSFSTNNISRINYMIHKDNYVIIDAFDRVSVLTEYQFQQTYSSPIPVLQWFINLIHKKKVSHFYSNNQCIRCGFKQTNESTGHTECMFEKYKGCEPFKCPMYTLEDNLKNHLCKMTNENKE